jgi:peptide/nickel transport system permease protein
MPISIRDSASAEPESGRPRGSGAGRTILRFRLATLGLGFAAAVLLCALAVPWLAPRDPLATDPKTRLARPGPGHWLGTDQFGRDVLTRVLYGSRVSLGAGFGAVTISLGIGVFLGAVAAMNEGFVDGLVMRVMDVLFAFPAILLALGLVAVLGAGLPSVILAIGLVYIPVFSRTARAAVLTVKHQDFVEAVRALGLTEGRAFGRHVLPNALAPVVVQATLSLSTAILAEATLSFLGLGNQPPAPSWGGMLSESRAFMEVAPWTAVFPGLAIMLAVLAFNVLGDGIRDLLDPRLRSLS